ncbi:unnamed protein product [Adineta steineri]|uniref:Glycoside hydrolase family 38 N-terminal domain-containing protein n=1 Tax=Adineta steineri TaxID=433720 RepID=A0A819Y4V1_9BILA|nr:unnamed protein product [Adineta steineri]CAF4153800.1 unnamed protein product [Adineta steineri]
MKFFICCLFLLISNIITLTNSVKSLNKCGYDTCNLGDATKLNVHLVPHSHDDVGFVKTLDEYYYGSRTDLQHAGVQYILDSIVLALDENPHRRFIYVEMAFLYRWWLQQTDEIRNKVKDFVN